MNPLRLFNYPTKQAAQAWTGHYQKRGDRDTADCVIGFSFGYRGKRRKVSPGLSNQDLANVAIKHYGPLPKIFQFEIADAYAESGGPAKAPVLRIEKHRRAGQYLDTWEVADQARELMRQYGYHRPILLAHPFHMPRVQLVCSRLGMNWIATGDCRGAVEFDPQSSQKWTRSVDAWRGYEPLAMAFYRMKGWV